MKQQILIIGGGFAGLHLAEKLSKNIAYEITLIDKNNYNYFTPLLYQVATGFLEPSNISYPFRKLFRRKKIHFRMADLVKVDTTTQTAYLNDGELKYDQLVFAAGAKTNFYGNESAMQNAISLKNVDDAIIMRNTFLKAYEKASVSKDMQERKKLLTIVIAGAGPTGVEIAGMLGEMKKYINKKDYPEINVSGEIYVIDAGADVLPQMSEKTHKETYEALTKSGVQVKLKTQVTEFNDGKVKLSSGETIEAQTLIWAAGITANTFEGIPLTSIGAGKRMITNEFNRVKGFENVWAIGDISIQVTDKAYPKGHPQLVQVAMQQGDNLAKNFSAIVKHKPLKAFKYFDKGDMAIVGHYHAVVDLFKNKIHIRGFAALFIWMFTLLSYLINYTNKIKTFYNWTIAYVTRDQALRIIFRE